MTTEGWIFMVGFRVFDVGLLVVWLIWFFRLRDDGDDSQGEDGGGGDGGNPRPSGDGPGGNGFRLPLGPARPASHRIRDHSPRHAPRRRRGPGQPVPRPLPARVRRPHAPVPVHKRA
jgi:hypothetical protein